MSSEEEKDKDRLVLSTQKSLYDPIEITIDKQVYPSVKTTRAVLKQINELDDQIQKNPTDDALLYKSVQLLFAIDPKILDKLERREVEEIYVYYQKKFIEIETQRAKIVSESFSKVLIPGKQKVIEKIPSQKRPGDKP